VKRAEPLVHPLEPDDRRGRPRPLRPARPARPHSSRGRLTRRRAKYIGPGPTSGGASPALNRERGLLLLLVSGSALLASSCSATARSAAASASRGRSRTGPSWAHAILRATCCFRDRGRRRPSLELRARRVHPWATLPVAARIARRLRLRRGMTSGRCAGARGTLGEALGRGSFGIRDRRARQRRYPPSDGAEPERRDATSRQRSTAWACVGGDRGLSSAGRVARMEPPEEGTSGAGPSPAAPSAS
jgi:hypothetical protein